MNLPALPSLPPNFPLTQKQLVIVGGVLLVALIVGFFIFTNMKGGDGGPTLAPVTLTVWGPMPESPAIKAIMEGYPGIKSNVTVRYRSMNPATYENTLLDALAAGEGPDVFMVENRWIPKHKGKLLGIDPVEFKTAGAIGLADVFPQAVARDFVDPADGKIYALPLYLDTLALFYNRDLLNRAGIVFPPKTWKEFQAAVNQLKALQDNGQIVRAGAAIGGSARSIKTGVDLLNLLMLQNGASMTNDDPSAVDFMGGGSDQTAGLDAFRFYLQFASPSSPYYTWNDNQGDAVQSFSEGKAAMMFAYRDVIADLEERAPFLNFAIAPMPQPDGAERVVNYPRYMGLAVWKQSKAPQDAWEFVRAVATNPELMRGIAEGEGRPPALLALIDEKKDDAALGIFARQALTAESWHQIDAEEVQDLFSAAIARVLSGQADPERALGEVQEQITALTNSRNAPQDF